MRNIRIIIILAWLIAVCSCGGGSGLDAKFQEIDRLCDSIPEAAIDSLASIDQTGLSEKDLNRYRLLWIKSRDKAYIAHTSDTLILDVIDYYDKHRSEGLYAEALYYGGRVYSDIGDLPTALEFFQKSLDEIPEDTEHLRLKSTVLNQTGRLLHNLRLDSAAIDYLEQSLLIDIQNNDDESGQAFTHGLISGSYQNLRDFQNARRHINEALTLSCFLNDNEQQDIKAELAEMLLHEGKIDSALMVIKSICPNVDHISLPYYLAVASEIYRDAKIPDTAYMFARKLTRLNTHSNKKTGYKVIFSDELSSYVPKDTLLKLLPEYKTTVEDYLNTHEAEQAITQNSQYNYSLHSKKREAVEQRLRSIKQVIGIVSAGLIIILLTILSIIFWRKYHRSKNDSQIMEGMILADKLKEKSSFIVSENNNDIELINQLTYALHEKQVILDEIKNTKKMNPSESIEKTLKESALYKDLKEKAENKKVMGKDVTWRMIYELIESVSPGFDNRLTILTETKITISERNVAYLLKFGFTQTQIASLLAKDASTISAQRSSLAKKIGYDKSTIGAIIVRL